MSTVATAPVGPAAEELVEDLVVAPLDGRLTADSRYEEEIELLTRRGGRITAGCVESSDRTPASPVAASVTTTLSETSPGQANPLVGLAGRLGASGSGGPFQD